MKMFLFQFLIFVVMGMASAKAAKIRVSSEVLGAYLQIQESLANDSMGLVAAAAAEMSKRSTDPGLKTAAQALSRDTELSSAREHFQKIAPAMDQWARTEKPIGIDRVKCPMNRSTWLQKQGPIRNPYYGKKMLDCGIVQK